MPRDLALFRSREANGFNRAISPSIYMAQFFGVMPLHNLLEYDVILLEFKLKSWKSAYSYLCIMGTLINTITAFIYAYMKNFQFSELCE